MPATAEKVEVHQRQGYIGGSDAAALLRISPWSTPLQVFAEKTGNAIPRVIDASQEAQQFFGKNIEAAIGKGVERYHKIGLKPSTVFWRAKDRKFMGGHIDFLCTRERAFVECKNIRFPTPDWGAAKNIDPDGDNSGLIPNYYLAQVDHYMYVLDFEYCYLAALFGGNELRLYRILRDEVREQTLLKVEDDLWDRVQRFDPPMGEGYDDFCLALQLGYIKRISAKEAKKIDPVQLSDDQIAILKLLRMRRIELNKLDADCKQLRKDFIGSLQGKLGYFCDRHGEELGLMSVRGRKGLDKALLKIEHPDLYAKFELESFYPTLKLAGVEEGDDD